jgi:lambda family phage tail tape measure protein
MADERGSSLFKFGDLRSMNTLTVQLVSAAQSFGKSITTAFAQGIIEGKRFEDVLRGIGKTLKESLLKTAVSSVSGLVSSLLDSGIKKIAGGLTGLRLRSGASSVSYFADGGVVASPSYFAMGRGLGLMGERGAEAIMPLSRGPDGKLGVRAGGGERRPVNVSVQIATRDADSFRRSEAQVSAAIARAVARGHRSL